MKNSMQNVSDNLQCGRSRARGNREGSAWNCVPTLNFCHSGSEQAPGTHRQKRNDFEPLSIRYIKIHTLMNCTKKAQIKLNMNHEKKVYNEWSSAKKAVSHTTRCQLLEWKKHSLSACRKALVQHISSWKMKRPRKGKTSPYVHINSNVLSKLHEPYNKIISDLHQWINTVWANFAYNY